MKVNNLSMLLLAALADATPMTLQRRQGMVDYLMSFVPNSYRAVPESVRFVQPKLRQDSKRKIVRFGPFTLPPTKAGLRAASTRILS
jgi:hypothetical protein